MPVRERTSSDDPSVVVARNAGLPYSVVIGVLTGLLLLALTQPSLFDVDLYWHLRAGHELLTGATPHEIGTGWSYAPDPLDWTSTQWLAEIVLALLHQAWGWSALIVYRTLTASVALALLARSTLRGRPAALAAFPFLIAAIGVVSVSQERPQQATLIGAVLLGHVLTRALVHAELPRWWAVAPLTLVWANLHGGWVLAPAVFVLIFLSRALDKGPRDRVGGRALLLAGVTVVGGSITPSGPAGVLAVLRFSRSTFTIIEWMPTVPMDDIGYLLTAMVITVGVAWARPGAVPRSEALSTIVLILFALTAWRYVGPALVMLAPLVAHRLVESFPNVGRQPEPRWSVPIGISVAAALLVGGLATIPGRDHLPRDEYPISLAERIAEIPGSRRVLNDYNVSGFVLHFAGPDDQVGIDGRADRYSPEYIDAYSGLMELKGDWQMLLDELDPSVALLAKDRALAHALVAERSWTVLQEDGDWILLQSPAAG